jgi:Na+/melibiose symporter-like transporter
LGCFGVSTVLLTAFVAWERHTPHPMLAISFFRNPRFTAASAGIASVFFTMFGSIFLLTQYLQFVRGYSPLEAGLCLLPMALTMMVTAPLSARVVERVGTKVVVASGLALVTVSMLLMLQLETSTGYGNLVWRLMVMAVGMGLTMAPATESIMGSLPLANAGVGSAMNDTTRQVGGALGVAIIGSVLASSYESEIREALTGRPVPAEVAEQVEGSLGFALEAARRLGGPAGDALADAAREAFVLGMHRGLLVAAASTLVGAVVAAIWLPARAAHAYEDRDSGSEPERDAAPAPAS